MNRGMGREKGEGRREKGEGRREKGEGRREKGEGRKSGTAGIASSETEARWLKTARKGTEPALAPDPATSARSWKNRSRSSNETEFHVSTRRTRAPAVFPVAKVAQPVGRPDEMKISS